MRAIAFALLLVGCGVDGGNCYIYGEGCHQGKDGADGQDGRPGDDGTPGRHGVNGRDGEAGQDGAAGTNGAAGQTGEQGPQGEEGEQGESGPQGPEGSVGPQGPQGLPGSGITFIRPCPDVAGNYPETLMCAGGKLYGTYGSNNKVRLVELTPGSYYQTKDGRDCTFYVSADCQIN